MQLGYRWNSLSFSKNKKLIEAMSLPVFSPFFNPKLFAGSRHTRHSRVFLEKPHHLRSFGSAIFECPLVGGKEGASGMATVYRFKVLQPLKLFRVYSPQPVFHIPFYAALLIATFIATFSLRNRAGSVF